MILIGKNNKTNGKVLKNTLFLSGSSLANKLISFIVSLLIANHFGPSGYGKIAYAISLVTLFVFLSDLGISTLTIREVARRREEGARYLGASLFLRGGLSLVTYFLIIVIAILLKETGASLILIALIAGMMVANAFANCFENISTAFERMEINAIINTGRELLLLLGIMFVLLTKRGLIAVGSVYLMMSLVGLLAWISISPSRLTKPMFKFDWTFLGFLIRRGIPFALSGIFLFVYFRVDSVMLKLLKGVKEVGYYNAPYNLIYALNFFPASLTAALFPRFSRYSEEDKGKLLHALSRVLRYLLLLSLPIVFGGIILRKELLLLFYRKEYVPSIPVFSILLLVVALIWLNYTLITTLNSMGKEKKVALISGIALGINVALNMELIPALGARGAAVATLFTEIFLFLTSFLVVRGEIPLSLRKIFSVRGGIGVFLMSLITYLLRGYSLFLSIPVAAFFYLFFLLVSGAIPKEERMELMSFFVPRGR